MLSIRSFARSNMVSLPRLLVTAVGFFILLVIYYREELEQQWVGSGRITDWLSTTGGHDDLARELLSIIEEHSPVVPGISDPIKDVKTARLDLWPADNDANLLDTLDIKPRQILAMSNAHRGFIEAIEAKMPKYISQRRAPKQGIVTVGGGDYFPPLMVSLRLLRRTGTRLPVEVFLPEEEYEPELCEHVLPRLGAFCRTFPNFDGKIKHFQYKVFAMLLSSFSDVLWLDADNFPLRDAAPLFRSGPFRKTGLVTWPDLWQTSVSPAYYLISPRVAPPTPVWARASTESGQVLMSKAKHWKTLLLAAYYNYYGPGYYYPLLCQGGTGCGDKETFLPAAEAMGIPFYDVKVQPRDIGHYKVNSNPKRGVYRFGLIQGDLLDDYEVTLELERDARRSAGHAGGVDVHSSGPGSGVGGSTEAYDHVPPFFFHMSTPKWDAHNVFDHVGKYDLTWDSQGRPAAAFRDPPATADMIKGVERMVWEEVRWVGCNLEEVIGHWEGKRGSICQKLEDYFRDVLDTEAGVTLGLAGGLVPAPFVPLNISSGEP